MKFIHLKPILRTFRGKNIKDTDRDLPKSFHAFIERKLKAFNGMLSRNGGRSLINYLLRYVGDVGGRVTRFKVILICVFSFKLVKVFNAEGSKGLVLFLKSSSVLIQQAAAGYVIEDMNPLKRRVRRDRAGFPCGFPLVIVIVCILRILV